MHQLLPTCRVRFASRLTLRFCLIFTLGVLAGEVSFAQGSNRMTPIVRAIASARPSVVNIEGKKMVRNDSLDANAGDSFKQVKGMGTGLVIDQRGYILTNFHVVDGVARIQVRLEDQTQTIARLIAHDAQTDLAIIKVDLERELPVINIGTSSDLMEGETVIAMGNAFGYRHSTTTGIISALHRNVPISDNQVYYDLIQIDAAINPGNSGGPLLNIDGEVIGINAAVRVNAQNIAFAIPINAALDTAADLLRNETKETLSLDFETTTLYEEHRPKLVVKSVSPGSMSGLRPGDVIQRVNGIEARRRIGLERGLIGMRTGEDIQIVVARDDVQVVTNVKLQSSKLGVKPRLDADFNSMAWELLGLELEPVKADEVKHVANQLNGGMRVTRVRPNGPAAAIFIRTGDILIGLHEMETTSFDDLRYILHQETVQDGEKVVYYIVRGGTTLFGHIRVAQK